MKKMKQKIQMFFLVACAFITTPSHANNLINNSATGIVTGNIIQQGDGTIDVGSISYVTDDVQNVNVFAVVHGDIIASTDAHISIGSYRGK